MKKKDNEIFEHCKCPEEKKIKYSLLHEKPRPQELPQKVVETIQRLLWYTPNNDHSYQTYHNEYLKDIEFEDAVMQYFIDHLKWSLKDICWENNKYKMGSSERKYKKVCLICHKVVLSKMKGESKLSCLLRHTRNCITHGRFNFLDKDKTEIIGFDFDKDGECTAIIKINISRLNDFCIQLEEFSEFVISKIFEYKLEKDGFKDVWLESLPCKKSLKYNFEDYIFAHKKDIFLRIIVIRYLKETDFSKIDVNKGYCMGDPIYLSNESKLIDIFYYEKYPVSIKKIEDKIYIINKDWLKKWYTDPTISFEQLVRM